MFETPRVIDLKARLAALPEIDSAKFKAVCRELEPVDPFDFLVNATENRYPETVYYVYVSADGFFKFKDYEMKRDEPTLKCAKNWLEHTYDRRFYRTIDEAAAVCRFLTENCPDSDVVRTRILHIMKKEFAGEVVGINTEPAIDSVRELSRIAAIRGLDPDIVQAAMNAISCVVSYKTCLGFLEHKLNVEPA